MKRWLICLMWVMAGVEVAEAGAVTFTPKIGTLGLGGEVTVDVAKNKNIRFGYNFAAMNITVLMDEAKVEGELRWQTIPLLLDWHPKGGSFRFTGGVMINNNTVDIKADPTDLIELDGTEYRIISMSGKIDFQPVSPYIGLGFGPAPDAVKDDLKGGGWSFFCDAGVLYQGPPDVSASAKASDAGLQSILNTALAKEVKEFEDDISYLRWYPVFAIGVTLRF